MNGLAERHCTPLSARTPPLGEDEVRELLAQLPGWSLEAGAIARAWDFSDFFETMAFVNAVAWIAHREDHHPDMTIGFNRCEIRYSTHSVGGLSINDFICAARIDNLYP